MNTRLTIEESARLIKLGVDEKLASGYEEDAKNCRYAPVFTLTDVLSILPKEIEYDGLIYGVNIWVDGSVWNVEYSAEKGVYDFLINSNIDSPELIDALNQLLIWCFENHYINTENK